LRHRDERRLVARGVIEHLLRCCWRFDHASSCRTAIPGVRPPRLRRLSEAQRPGRALPPCRRRSNAWRQRTGSFAGTSRSAMPPARVQLPPRSVCRTAFLGCPRRRALMQSFTGHQHSGDAEMTIAAYLRHRRDPQPEPNAKWARETLWRGSYTQKLTYREFVSHEAMSHKAAQYRWFL
jgi:hypothetical protein